LSRAFSANVSFTQARDAAFSIENTRERHREIITRGVIVDNDQPAWFLAR